VQNCKTYLDIREQLTGNRGQP